MGPSWVQRGACYGRVLWIMFLRPGAVFGGTNVGKPQSATRLISPATQGAVGGTSNEGPSETAEEPAVSVDLVVHPTCAQAVPVERLRFAREEGGGEVLNEIHERIRV